ncbi:tetratricopeptide repeat protein [Salinibacter ruber]|uniref:type IX secretion system periplasmic lipoprotein PorW/SprE n=1 Tax=Salinibacter ruber TaxID=146919 RepID=UPI002073DB21|nr:tetratricopeptide repeat protein [Salinibacter ruber]
MGRFSPRGRTQVRTVCGLLFLLVGAGLLMSCGRGSFIGRQYDDLTAYYNTFHNATQAFEAGLESVNESGGDIDRTRYLSVFPPPQGGAGQSSFEEAIQKSAAVLREHPNSEWVDDALLLIGRSRYYQQNYVGAVQKFREAIALDAEREGEARFRLAQTLVVAGRYREAAEALRTGLDSGEEYGSWTARMRVVQGELFVRQENWEAADQALAQGLNNNLPDETGARAAFLLGQVRETLDDPEGARAAYRRVSGYDPPYPLAFAAKLAAIELGGETGPPGRALERLAELERDDNTREMRAEIARVRARLHRAQGRPDRAQQVLTAVLRGDQAPRGSGKGQTHYELATLYRDAYEDFTRAAAHFDTASATLSSGPDGGTGAEEAAQVLPRAPSDARAQANRFRKLADRSQAVARMDSLLRLGRMAPAEFRAVVEKIRQRRLKEQEARAQRTRRQPQFRGGRRPAAGDASPAPSEQPAVQTQGADAGFLFHRDPTLVQQGRRQFEQTWGDRPLMDDWRRAEAIRGRPDARPRAGQTEDQARPQSSAGASTTASVVDVSAVPRDSISRAEMKDQRAVAQYELANALFRAAGRPDSAQTWFRRVLDETPDHPVAPQALYGLAQAHRAQGDTAAGEDAYRRLIDEHPDTPIAKRAREQLGLATTDEDPERTVSRADSAYARAYEAWRSGRHDAALRAFLKVADAYRETSVAPRALLAAGVVYHRTARHDSSGQGRARFTRYADSLAQADAPDPGPDPTGSSSPDATAPAPPSSDAAAPARPAPADTTDASAPEGPPRRMIDSTAVANQGASGTPSDSAVASPSVVRDTATGPSGRSEPPDTTTSAVARETARSDSTSAAPQSRREPADPFEILLSHLVARYPETAEAEQAQALLDQLRERRPGQGGTTRDSTGAGAPDGPGANRESGTVAPEVDTTKDRPRPPDEAAGPAARRRPAPTTPSQSGRERATPSQRRDSSATPTRSASSLQANASRRPPT